MDKKKEIINQNQEKMVGVEQYVSYFLICELFQMTKNEKNRDFLNLRQKKVHIKNVYFWSI